MPQRDEPTEDELVIVIDGEANIEEQKRSFDEQLQRIQK